MRSLPYKWPPPPRGIPGSRKAGGYAANGDKVGDFGDWIEDVVSEGFGLVNLRRLEGSRQGAFDLRAGDRVFELKACTVESTEYKMKPKAREVTDKREAARKTGMTACSAIAVVDGSTVHLYWREGIGAFRLTPDWNYAGSVKVPRKRSK